MIPTTPLIKSALIFFTFSANLLAGEVWSQERTDLMIKNASGMDIHIRSVKPLKQQPGGIPVVLIHGGGGSSIATFDNGVKEYSLTEDLVTGGHTVYLVNLRGWERSYRSAAMNEPPGNNPPQVNSDEALEDILAAVNWISKKEDVSKINLLGWASGGHWAAMFASRRNELVAKLILVNTMYGVSAPWKIGEGSDPDSVEAYRQATAENLVRRWELSIPSENKKDWRQDEVVKAYQTKCLESDPTSYDRNPPSVRIPYGYWKEHLEMSRGKKFYAASAISVPVLLIRGGLDFWSRPEDLAALKAGLVNSPELVVKEIEQATHFIFFDRPGKGRKECIDTLLAFLKKKTG